MDTNLIKADLARLLEYAKLHLDLDEEDATYVNNLLLKDLCLDAPYEGEVKTSDLASLLVPDTLLENFVPYMVENLGMKQKKAERELVYILGLLTPMPSKVNKTFFSLRDKDPKMATDYFYNLCLKNQYVFKTKIDKNLLFTAHYEDGPDLDISINLSKPEKNNKDIAKLADAKSSGYPACLLCHENLGYEGRDNHPARENIRLIPLTLGQEKWYLQYSPYGYFKEHCILLSSKHEKMSINKTNLSHLFEFVDLFPHYFIGSNSDLPIVGGSILNHEHFQGGLAEMPVMKSLVKKLVAHEKFPHTTLSILDFYDTVLRLDGLDKKEMLEFACAIVDAWKHYDDPSCDIISSDENGQHSTVTPLLRKRGDSYQMFIILRNNRCDATYPDGIFHAHPEYAHIKHEGIGLIEAAGLFILPARLLRQGKEVSEIVKKGIPKEEYLKMDEGLDIFDDMVKKMKENGWSANDYYGYVCQNILRNVAVYKNDKKGEEGLDAFLRSVNL